MSERSTDPTGAIRGRDAAILAILLTSYVMIVLDISVVITGLPRLAAELHFSAAELLDMPASDMVWWLTD